VISVAYVALLSEHDQAPRAGDDAADARWWPAHSPPSLAFDHDLILDLALERLRARTLRDPADVALLPRMFRLHELHSSYQSIIGERIDWPEISQRMLSSGLVEPAPDESSDDTGCGGLYRFRADTGAGPGG
jgi:8-oxo-dGTP diphosphatase